MGTSVFFESRRMLLQREDFPAALRAVQKIAKTVPRFFRREDEVQSAKDLPSALAAGDFPIRFDAHGDVVHLVYGGDKWPPGGPDAFPEHLVFGLKRWLRDTRFDLRVEGVPGTRLYFVERGVVQSNVIDADGRRFEQLGNVPVCKPGETVEVRFRLGSFYLEGASMEVRASDSAEAARTDFEPRVMGVGEEATIRITVRDDGPWFYDGCVGVSLYGRELPDGPQIHARIEVLSALEPYDLDAAHEVVETRSTLQARGRRGAYLPAKALAHALEDIRRYAARHHTEPGGEFLERVAAAPNLASALRAAAFETTFDEQGALRGLAFAGNKLPGGERQLLGLLRSYAALTGASSERISFAYAFDPAWWTTLVFDPGGIRRVRERRAASR